MGPALNQIWFSALPACHGVQLDRNLLRLLLHALHINVVSQCFISPPPGAANAGPRVSSGASSGPVTAVARSPVNCGAGAGYRRRWRDPIPSLIGPGGFGRSMPAKGPGFVTSDEPRPPGPSEFFVVVRHHTDVVGPNQLKEALGFRRVEYIPQPSNLHHLLLVRINEVEQVKQYLFSLVLPFGL
jgi:hypothetical protein